MARYSDPRVEADPEVVVAKAALDAVPDDASYDTMMDAVEALQEARRRVDDRLGHPFRIDTDRGEYIIYRAGEAGSPDARDTTSGTWFFQPADVVDGEVFSSGYPTAEEAEQAALEWVANEQTS